jgi:hypothetical protein
MTDDGELDVFGINRVQHIALLSNDALVPIVEWVGRDGEPCSPWDAVSCVCGSDEFGWFSVDLSAYPTMTVH